MQNFRNLIELFTYSTYDTENGYYGKYKEFRRENA